jgi:excisionase family DNA binding protein
MWMEASSKDFIFIKPVRAAKLLDMSKSKIYEMIQRKELPAVKLGGCLRVPFSAIEELVVKARSDER